MSISGDCDGGGRVLIVEDDGQISALLAHALRAEGLEPLCVHSDMEAYQALPTIPTFCALITDVNLGKGTTGFDVARFARAVIPKIAVLYVSGDVSEESFRAHGVPDSNYLVKPFAMAELLEKLRGSVAR